MVDLNTQYARIQDEINRNIQEVLDSARFIGGPVLERFRQNLAAYLDVKHVITCANGTDALQIALMALDLHPGDEVIVPAHTYVATAEVIALLRLKPVMVDVDRRTMNVTAEIIEAAITPKTKAVVPVHLYGQAADMEAIMRVAEKHGLFVVEDNAQAIGAEVTFSDGTVRKTGTIGHIGTTSFFPSKNLGCYGDGGAIFTDDDVLAQKLQMIANHGQSKKYHHDVIGCNSRLDAIQAAVLDVKLKYLDEYSAARNKVAGAYDAAFAGIDELITPYRAPFSTHVFHQYTLQVQNGKRDALKVHLAEKGIPSMIYYPVPLYKQKAFASYHTGELLPVTEYLSETVLSLPMHTEMTEETLAEIVEGVGGFFELNASR